MEWQADLGRQIRDRPHRRKMRPFFADQSMAATMNWIMRKCRLRRMAKTEKLF